MNTLGKNLIFDEAYYTLQDIGMVLIGLLFDYATLFQAQHERIAPPTEFRFSDAQYAKFVTCLKERSYPCAVEHGID